jgi:AraC-like DNA-binding protein
MWGDGRGTLMSARVCSSDASPATAALGDPSFVRLGIARQALAIGQDAASPRLDRLSATQALDDNRVSLKALGSLMMGCAEHTGLPHCGIMLGGGVELSELGALGPIIRAKDSLGSALRELVSDLGRDAGAVVALDERADVAVLRFLPYDPDVEGVAALGEAFLAALTRIARELCGADWRPSEVLLARRPPANAQPYHAFFRAPVRFDEETAALVISARALRMPCLPLAATHLTPEPALRSAAESTPDLVDTVRRLLRTELLRGSPGCTEVARHFSVNRRTLNRRLRANGTHFRNIVDEVRFAVARQLVSDTDIPLGQLSAALHFSEASAFTRAFERWAGVSPSRLRGMHRAALSARVADRRHPD